MLAALLGAVTLLLAGCQPPSASLDSTSQVDLTAKTPKKVTGRNPGPVLKPQTQAARYQVFPGASPTSAEDGGEPPPGVGAQDDGKFTINLDGASVAEASKLILGETLGYNYTIDPVLQGSITMVSNRPLSSRQLLDTFEAALRMANVALVQNDGNFKVVQLQQVMDGDVAKAEIGPDVGPGFGVSAVPLRYVGPSAMVELLDGFVAQVGSTRVGKAGNMILIRGPAAQRRSLVEVVMSFDVDWMKDQTSAVAAIANGRAEEIAAKVERIFAQDSASAGPNAVRLIPVPGINSVIVIAKAPDKVQRALTWIKRLDRESLDAPKSYVYAVQNGSAVELAKILSATYGSGSSAGTTAEVAPNSTQVGVGVGTGEQGSSGAPQQQQQQGDDGSGMAPQQDQQGADGMTTSSTSTAATSGGSSTDGGIRITPIPTNNTILIRATPKDYREILATLNQIDAPATQVLINTMIAEVRLNDELNYGVQAYFQSHNFDFLFKTTEGAATSGGAILSPKIPGMNFMFNGIADPKVVIDALSQVTNVKIVSSPSLLVLENETATIKVGDEIPIQTQTETTSGGQTVNSFDYKDTGVTLKVRPRVSTNGMVTIDLGQELRAAQQTTGVGDNPQFSQRTINSKVSVNDQQTVLLGGLISGQEETARTTVPGAAKVPLVGRLVGSTGGKAVRNEMIVFITPTIIRNGDEASRKSQDVRDTMRSLNFK